MREVTEEQIMTWAKWVNEGATCLHEWPERKELILLLAATREREAGLAALVDQQREYTCEVVQCAVSGTRPSLVSAGELLSLTPPAALDDLRRRERSIGAEEELRRIADLIETEALDERFAALFCADMRDRADAIAAEREEGE